MVSPAPILRHTVYSKKFLCADNQQIACGV